jgi:hypothetical protein
MNLRTSIKLFVVLAALAALPGCASLSKDECLSANWYDIGIRDGANGRGEEYVAHHAAACSKLGVEPDRERWLDGRDRGLERYCTARNGFRVGEYGGSYNGVCFAIDEHQFLRGYDAGRRVYDSKSRLDRIVSEIQSTRQALSNDKLEQRDRDRLLYRLRELEYQRDGAQREYDNATWRGRTL